MKKQSYERPVIQRLKPGITGKFGMKDETSPVTQVDGNSVSDLLSEFGSPLFVISEKTIRQTYRDIHRAFVNRYPKVQFAWSYKTNSSCWMVASDSFFLITCAFSFLSIMITAGRKAMNCIH